MSEATTYITEMIRTRVWSGFDDYGGVQRMIGDLLEPGVDEAAVRALVGPEFARKAEAEKSWPEVTDNDRLNDAFDALNRRGIASLQDAGHTQSDGMSDVSELIHDHPSGTYHGGCFYHGQDVERAVAGGGLMVAFASLQGEPEKDAVIAREVCEVLREFGFEVDWPDDPSRRIQLPKFNWQRRSMPYEPPMPEAKAATPPEVAPPTPASPKRSLLGRLFGKS